MLHSAFPRTTFGYVDGTFINMYGEENPILNIGDSCYFIFNDIDTMHRPKIGKGTIVDEMMTDSVHKTYYIELEEICENPMDLKRFVYDRYYTLYPRKNLSQRHKTLIKERTTIDTFKKYLFRVDCFFVRTTMSEMKEHRRQFCEWIKKDLLHQLDEIENVLG